MTAVDIRIITSSPCNTRGLVKWLESYDRNFCDEWVDWVNKGGPRKAIKDYHKYLKVTNIRCECVLSIVVDRAPYEFARGISSSFKAIVNIQYYDTERERMIISSFTNGKPHF